MSALYRGKKKIVKNVSLGALIQLLMVLSTIVTTPYITRIFSPSQMGIYGIGYSIVAFLSVVAGVGFEYYGARAISATLEIRDRSKVFFALWRLQIIFAFTLAFVYCTVLLIINPPNKMSYLLQVGMIISVAFDVSWLFMGVEDMALAVRRNIVSKIVVIAGIFLLVKTQGDLNLYIILIFSGTLIGNISSFLVSRKYVSFSHRKTKISRNDLVGILRLAAPASLISAINPIQNSIISGFSRGTYTTGIFDQSNRIINMLYQVIRSGLKAITPRLSHYAINESDYIKSDKYISIVSYFNIIVSTIFVVCIFNTATSFTSFFFGPKYQDIGGFLVVGSLMLFPKIFSVIISDMYLIPRRLDKVYGKSCIIRIISTILLTLLGVYFHGAMGAVVAVIISEFVVIASNLLFIKSKDVLLLFVRTCFLWLSMSFAAILFIKVFSLTFSSTNGVLSFVVNGCISASVCLIILSPIFIKTFRTIKPKNKIEPLDSVN